MMDEPSKKLDKQARLIHYSATTMDKIATAITPSIAWRSKEAPNSQVDQSNGKLLETIVNSKAVDHTSLGVAVASSQLSIKRAYAEKQQQQGPKHALAALFYPLQPLPMPSKTQTGNLPPLQLKNLSASARDVKTTGSGSKHSVGFVEDVTSKPAAGDREWPTWSSCQVDEVPAIVALSPPSKGPCQPMGPAAPPTPPADAPLDAKVRWMPPLDAKVKWVPKCAKLENPEGALPACVDSAPHVPGGVLEVGMVNEFESGRRG
eukprot:422905-Pelagomonas_calceolata.AAC.2